MGKRIVEVKSEQENTSDQDDECEPITEDDYELFELSIQHLQSPSEVTKSSQNNKKNLKRQFQDEDKVKSENFNQKIKRQRRLITQDEINCKDIIEIIIIIILVIILGISLFRVMFEVQIQYKFEEQRAKRNAKYADSQLSNYEKLNRKNNPNQNYDQINNKASKKVTQQSKIISDTQKNKEEKSINLNVSTQCRTHIWKLLNQKGNLYDFKVTYQELKLKSRVQKYKQNMNTQITKSQYQRAVEMLSLIHQTDFKGALNVKDTPCENVENKKLRLQKVVDKQRDEWNKHYDIHLYFQRQMRFCLVVNSYNNAENGLIYRNIDSILQQNYTNYHVVYTDDHSKDETGQKVKQYLIQKNVPQNLFHVIINEEQKGMMENIYTAIHGHCKNGEIVVMIDGDDSLIGTNVLSLMNAVYQKERHALIWGNFVTIFNNDQVNLGFSRDYPFRNKKEGSFRKIKVFISSHLKTFFVDVFKKINPSDLKTNDGKFYRGASDTAMMLPMIEMANPKIRYLPQILYEYRYDTGQSGNSVNRIPQKEALKKIFSSQAYKELTDFSFIEKAINQAINIPQEQIQQKSSLQNEIKKY